MDTGEKRLMTDLPSVGRSMDEALDEGNDEDRNERARRLATLRKRRQREKTTGEKRLMTDLPSVPNDPVPRQQQQWSYG